MGLLNTLKQIKDGGFDPSKDSITTSSRLDSGKYPVRLKSAERSADKSGREQVVITLEVVSGDHKDRTEMIFLGFDENLPEFVLEKNGRTLLKLGEFTKANFTQNDLTNEESTAEALQRVIGNQFLMDLRVVPNKKNPEYPYRNYDFDSLDAPDLNAASGEEDMDLPF